MKYAALLFKELRECLPWVLLASAILFLFGFLILYSNSSYRQDPMVSWNQDPGREIQEYQLFQWSSLSDTGPLLLFTCLGLGLALAVRQFWFSWFSRTWAFLLHRNLSRSSIVWIKIAATALCFAVPILGIWTLLFLYACFVVDQSPPPSFQIWLEGVFFILLSGIPYLAAALCSALDAKWYTTRLFPLGFALAAVLLCFGPQHLWINFLFAGILILILAIPLFGEFNRRQF